MGIEPALVSSRFDSVRSLTRPIYVYLTQRRQLNAEKAAETNGELQILRPNHELHYQTYCLSSQMFGIGQYLTVLCLTTTF